MPIMDGLEMGFKIKKKFMQFKKFFIEKRLSQVQDLEDKLRSDGSRTHDSSGLKTRISTTKLLLKEAAALEPKVMIVSAYFGGDFEKRAKNSHADEVFNKPLKITKLMALMKSKYHLK